MSETIYKAAIIGCGAIAGGYDRLAERKWAVTHAGGYWLCPRTRLTAAADSSGEALSVFGDRWDMANLYHDYRDMLDRERPDIVSICLPVDGHVEAFQAACDRGARALFLEKPAARHIEEVRGMSALAGAKPVAVNYFRRWNPTLRALKEELGRGEYGCPLRVTVHYVKGLLSNGSHFIDLLRWFFGEPTQARTIRVYEQPPGDAAADFELTFEGGVVAVFLHIPNPVYVLHDVDIFTEQARLVIGQRGQKILRFRATQDPYYQMFDILRLDGGVAETEWRDCSLRAIEEIVECLDRGGTPACTLEDGARAVALCRDILAQSPAVRVSQRSCG